MLRTTLDSTADGILVVNTDGVILNANRRFQALWRIPEELVSTGQDERLLTYVLDQLSDPEEFLRRVNEVYLTDQEQSDLLHFKDGPVSRDTPGIDARPAVGSFVVFSGHHGTAADSAGAGARQGSGGGGQPGEKRISG